ncbi:MAG TPA: alpha-amylase family glycosyl hydrolase [Opitutaceae bacterium]|jgi:glycogen operon protein
MHPKRLLELASLFVLAFGLAWAGPIGTRHPASGAYAPVNGSGWAAATWQLGATYTRGYGSTLEVAVYSANATNIVLEIYTADTGADAAYDYAMAKGPDNVWRAAVARVPGLALYAFRAWGPNWPMSSAWSRGNSSAGFISDCDAWGNRFNPNKVLYDPYARELSHVLVTPGLLAAGEGYGMYLSGGGPGLTYTGPVTGGTAIDERAVDTGHWAPKAVAVLDTTSTGPRPALNQKDAIIYEAHLRGLTAHPSSVNLKAVLGAYPGFQDAANVPDSLRGTYAGAAYMAGYLKDLGINTVEFLPVHETDNATGPTNASGANYWGYATYGFFAPDRRYARNQAPGGPTAEFKAMVAAFHRAGIEVYLDVVFNHSGEGGLQANGNPAVAELSGFRGLDNAAYYTLTGDGLQDYWDSTGVGNNLNAGSTTVQTLVKDSLTYWSQTMGVDGFRFDLAVELGRNGSSAFLANGSIESPLLGDIASQAATQGFKVIAEPWDTNDGSEVGAFPPGWAAWNGNYRDALRLAVTGNLSGANGVGYADAFYGDYAHFFREGGPQKSVNLLVCHDGFTITDLVSYAAKANASLAWPFGPSDGGSDTNNSSTWGGNATLRRQVIRTLWAFQVLSRGLPMLVWGDELGRTVNGNNNAYNVDSVATWNNYAMLGGNTPDAVPTADATGGTLGYANNLGTFSGPANENFLFLRYLLHLRAAHAAFRQQDYSMPVTYMNSDGSGGFNEWSNPAALIYLGGSKAGDTDFVVLCNLSGVSVTYGMPSPPVGSHWVRLIDTNAWAEPVANSWEVPAGAPIFSTYGVGNQSLVLLQAVPNTVRPAKRQ